jgi:hypothetical protein
MKSLAVFMLVVVGSIGLGMLLHAGRIFWPAFAVIVGAYIIGQLPAWLKKVRSFSSAPTAGPNDKP